MNKLKGQHIGPGKQPQTNVYAKCYAYVKSDVFCVFLSKKLCLKKKKKRNCFCIKLLHCFCWFFVYRSTVFQCSLSFIRRETHTHPMVDLTGCKLQFSLNNYSSFLWGLSISILPEMAGLPLLLSDCILPHRHHQMSQDIPFLTWIIIMFFNHGETTFIIRWSTFQIITDTFVGWMPAHSFKYHSRLHLFHHHLPAPFIIKPFAAKQNSADCFTKILDFGGRNGSWATLECTSSLCQGKTKGN